MDPKLVGQHLKKVPGCLSDLVFKSARQRVRDLLRELAAAPGTRVANGLHRVVIRLRLSRQDLARRASTSRPAATTLRCSLQWAGVLMHARRHLFRKRLDPLSAGRGGAERARPVGV